MARGQLLYRDVWEQRPPGIYWAYLGAFQLFGWTAAAVAWLDLVLAAITTLLLYGVGRTLAGPPTGAVAAAVYAVFTMPAWLYSYGGFLERAVSETFIVVCVAAMAWCAVRWQVHGSRWSAAGLGLFAGATLIFKPNAGLYFPALLLWSAVYGRARATTRRAAGDLVVAGAAALVVPLLALVWLWRLDLLHDAKVAVIDFNRYYVGEGFALGAYTITFAKAVWLRIKTEPVWLAGAVGSVFAARDLVRRRPLPPLAGLTVIWGAAAVCVIVVNGARLYNSYFIQALPPLALLGAWLLTAAPARSRAARAAALATMAGIVMLMVQRDYTGRVFGQAAIDLQALTGEVDRASYLERFGGYNNKRGYSARANSELADYVRARSAPDDRLFVFGINGAGAYFDADRLSAHRFLRVNFFIETEFPDPAFRLDAVVRDLERAAPKFLVFERLHVSSLPEMARRADNLPEDPDLQQLLRDYRRVAQIEDFAVYERVK